MLLPVHWEAIMGGAQYQAKLLIERLLDRYDVEVHYLTVRCDPGHDPKGYVIHRFSSRDGIRRYGYFFDALRLYRLLRKLRPDVIYQQVGCAHTGIAAWYARRNGAQMAWRVSSDRSLTKSDIRWWKLHQRIEKACLDYGIRNADLILAQTKTQRSMLAENYARHDAKLVPNFHPSPQRPERRGGKANVLWIANFKPLKNPHAFVRLAASFGGNAHVRFVMIGAVMQQDQWTRDLLRAIDAVPNLVYLGARSQDQVNAALCEARVLVNTSDYEGFSNTFIQAWMREVPVVSLRVDPDGLLAEQGLGFLSRTEEQLRLDVQRLVEDEHLAAAIGGRCREYALRNHSMRNVDRIAALLGLAPKTPAAESSECFEEIDGRDKHPTADGRSWAPPSGGLSHASDATLGQ